MGSSGSIFAIAPYQSEDKRYQGSDKSRAQVAQSQASGGQSVSLCPPYQFCGSPHRGYCEKIRDKASSLAR